MDPNMPEQPEVEVVDVLQLCTALYALDPDTHDLQVRALHPGGSVAAAALPPDTGLLAGHATHLSTTPKWEGKCPSERQRQPLQHEWVQVRLPAIRRARSC